MRGCKSHAMNTSRDPRVPQIVTSWQSSWYGTRKILRLRHQGELVLGRCHDVVNREAVLRHQRLQRRGRAEGLHADDTPALADVALPAEGGRLLDRDASRHLLGARRCRGTPVDWCSKMSHDGIETTRERDALGEKRFVRLPAPARPRCRWQSASRQVRPLADRPERKRRGRDRRPRRTAWSIVGSGCRDRTTTAGSWRNGMR